MLKTTKRLIIIFVLMFLLLSSGCGVSTEFYRDIIVHNHDKTLGYERPKFVTQLTQIEHQERIMAKAKQKFEGMFSNSNTVYTFSIDIIYSFQEKPEFFLIQEYGEKNSFKAPTRYWMGYIENDVYYLILDEFDYIAFCDESDNLFIVEAYKGENPYSKIGVSDNKKYYGGFGKFAWQKGEDIIGCKVGQYTTDLCSYMSSLSIMKKEEIANYENCRFVYYSRRILFDDVKMETVKE